MKQTTKQVIISVVKKKEIRWLNFFPVEMSLAFIMTIARGESTHARSMSISRRILLVLNFLHLLEQSKNWLLVVCYLSLIVRSARPWLIRNFVCAPLSFSLFWDLAYALSRQVLLKARERGRVLTKAAIYRRLPNASELLA